MLITGRYAAVSELPGLCLARPAPQHVSHAALELPAPRSAALWFPISRPARTPIPFRPLAPPVSHLPFTPGPVAVPHSYTPPPCRSGNDDECHDARHGNGATGVISVTSNVIPGLMHKLMHGAGPEPELNDSLKELMSWLFCEPNPIALNTALAMCGLVRPVFRLPYVPLSRAQREKGAKLLSAVQEHIPGCTGVRVMEDHEFQLIGRY